jgi:cytochrome c peroxidase
VNQDGLIFRDPDGDPLTYEMTFSTVSSPPSGLSVSGSLLSGVPTDETADSVYTVSVTARDDHGGAATDSFALHSKRNSPPEVVSPNQNRIVQLGLPLDHDATQDGTTFRDPDGHMLSYTLTIMSAPTGFIVQGTRITGTFSTAGFVKARIQATDGFGGSSEDEFALVVPAAISARPSLPAVPFTYDDAQLPLPNIFRVSSLDVLPLWDTTPADNRTSNHGATLGRVLFYDKRLSITNTAACGSCHQQAHGFATSERFGRGAFEELTERNPMGLTNVRYNIHDQFFMDMRVTTLERLALMPIQNATELGNTLPLLEQKLAATDFYPPLFQAAFGTPEITSERIAKALAQFLRSLMSYQSTFDRAFHEMDPDNPPDPAAVLTAQEMQGLTVFQNSGCFFCHSTDVHTAPGASNNGLDEISEDAGVRAGHFRPASLRNIAVSGPYMHDGRFATLREVIDHYDSGIKDTPELTPPLRDLEGPLRLNLTEEEKAALEAFLNALTDSAFLADPKFSDPFQ